MKFITTDEFKFQMMISHAIRDGLTFTSTYSEGFYTITYLGGF